MTSKSHDSGDRFYKPLALVTILSSLLLVCFAGAMPEGLNRGQVIVYGHEALFVFLATALTLHAAYRSGFNKAMELAQVASKRSVRQHAVPA